MVDVANSDELPLENEAELLRRAAPMERFVTIYGGSGFIGRHTVRALAKEGWRIRVAVRRPDLAGHLQPLGSVGQINAVQANLRYPASVLRAAEGAEVVINAVGVLHESGRQGFDAVHGFGAKQVALAAKEVGARLIHISAIGSDADSKSSYATSKAAGEAAVLEVKPDAIIFRPSVVFGPEDDFFNRFAAMSRLSPFLPLIGGGETKFQPVFVGDVAAAITKAVDELVAPGKIYELAGPEILTFKQLMEMMLQEIGRKRLLLPIPEGLAMLKARVLELLPNPLLTRDQVKLLGYDNIASEAAKAEGRTLEGLGIHPTAIGAVLPGYLWRYRKAGQFTRPEAA